MNSECAPSGMGVPVLLIIALIPELNTRYIKGADRCDSFLFSRKYKLDRNPSKVLFSTIHSLFSHRARLLLQIDHSTCLHSGLGWQLCLSDLFFSPTVLRR